MKINSDQVKAINIKDKLSLFSEHWDPKIIGTLNDHKIQVAKIKGQFVWHYHEKDELFLVIKGQLTIHFRDRDLIADEGELILVPHHLEHMTEAVEETHIVLIETIDTLNTGNVIDPKLSATDQENI